MTSHKKKRSILMTMALPYANGDVHLGHMVEAIQADIWARFQRLQNHHVLFISGSDAHGTPIMLTAEKKGITPEALIKAVHKDHEEIFKAFYISFDNFYTTHSKESEALLHIIYERLKKNDDIDTKVISQAYDPIKKVFLADRYIKGECPRCHAKNQYGDNCEVCGSTYNPKDLINPVSILSGTTPIEKETLHYFFKLDKYTTFLKNWIHSGKIQTEMAHKLNEWFEQGLKSWDISRDAPYFGFRIPETDDKYFYVWLDAPVGYMASLKNFLDQHHHDDFDEYWKKDSPIELYHFIGKDIVYFHALFWPAMLHGSNYRLPTGIFVHGFLTINGQKMSKSRETFITAHDYLQQLNPELIRYYFACKLNAQIEDIDLNFNDFIARVNADLVGKYVNLASRCAGFITKKFQGKLSNQLADPALFDEFVKSSEHIQECFETLNYNRAIRDIMALADRANQYIDLHKPWALAKIPDQAQAVQDICTQGLNCFRLLTIFLKPILPEMAKKVEAFLNIDALNWKDISTPLLDHKINPFTPLMQRITEEDIKPLVTC